MIAEESISVIVCLITNIYKEIQARKDWGNEVHKAQLAFDALSNESILKTLSPAHMEIVTGLLKEAQAIASSTSYVLKSNQRSDFRKKLGDIDSAIGVIHLYSNAAILQAINEKHFEPPAKKRKMSAIITFCRDEAREEAARIGLVLTTFQELQVSHAEDPSKSEIATLVTQIKQLAKNNGSLILLLTKSTYARELIMCQILAAIRHEVPVVCVELADVPCGFNKDESNRLLFNLDTLWKNKSFFEKANLVYPNLQPAQVAYFLSATLQAARFIKIPKSTPQKFCECVTQVYQAVASSVNACLPCLWSEQEWRTYRMKHYPLPQSAFPQKNLTYPPIGFEKPPPLVEGNKNAIAAHHLVMTMYSKQIAAAEKPKPVVNNIVPNKIAFATPPSNNKVEKIEIPKPPCNNVRDNSKLGFVVARPEVPKPINSNKLKRSSFRTLRNKDGEYNGYVDENGKKCGQGVHVNFADGCKYDGEWMDDKRHGSGTLFWANGKKNHEGGWKNGLIDGAGTSFDCNGNVVKKGVWTNGVFQGERLAKLRDEGGVNVYANGIKHDGKWKDGMRQGTVTRYSSHGAKSYFGE